MRRVRQATSPEPSRLDRWLPSWDVRSRHSRALSAAADAALAAALGPLPSDPVIRALVRLRGLRLAPSFEEFFSAYGFEVLERTATSYVAGFAGRPWRRRPLLRRVDDAQPGDVRVVVELRATPSASGCVLSTETRIAATDARSRRLFRTYWLVVGPFSSLIRRRWLAAAARAL